MARASRLLTAILAGFLLIVCDGEIAQSASAPVIPRDLFQTAQSQGNVRVIVELAISAAARATVDSDIVRDMRRKEVAQAQDRVRGSLLGTAHSTVREYQELPFIALEVGVDGLRTLESLYGLIIRALPDRLEKPFLSESVPLVQADKAWAGAFSGIPVTAVTERWSLFSIPAWITTTLSYRVKSWRKRASRVTIRVWAPQVSVLVAPPVHSRPDQHCHAIQRLTDVNMALM